MSDILCAKCGEPWDAYGVRNGDMEPEESKKFLSGEGCPVCGFGNHCTECLGSGKRITCPSCKLGMLPKYCHGVVNAWSPNRAVRGFEPGQWYVGYQPNVAALPEDVVPFGPINIRDCGDGPYQERKMLCPYAVSEPCSVCSGSGKLTVSDEEAKRFFEDAVISAVEASDEEPMGIISAYLGE